jgi:hypothetical protein
VWAPGAASRLPASPTSMLPVGALGLRRVVTNNLFVAQGCERARDLVCLVAGQPLRSCSATHFSVDPRFGITTPWARRVCVGAFIQAKLQKKRPAPAGFALKLSCGGSFAHATQKAKNKHAGSVICGGSSGRRAAVRHQKTRYARAVRPIERRTRSHRCRTTR